MNNHTNKISSSLAVGKAPFLKRVLPKSLIDPLHVPKLASPQPQIEQPTKVLDRIKHRIGVKVVFTSLCGVRVSGLSHGLSFNEEDRQRPELNPDQDKEFCQQLKDEKRVIARFTEKLERVKKVFVPNFRGGGSCPKLVSNSANHQRRWEKQLAFGDCKELCSESKHSFLGEENDRAVVDRRLKFQRRLPVVRFEILEGDEEAIRERGVTFIDRFKKGHKLQLPTAGEGDYEGEAYYDDGNNENDGCNSELRSIRERRLPVVRFEILDGDEEAEQERGVTFLDMFEPRVRDQVEQEVAVGMLRDTEESQPIFSDFERPSDAEIEYGVKGFAATMA